MAASKTMKLAVCHRQVRATTPFSVLSSASAAVAAASSHISTSTTRTISNARICGDSHFHLSGPSSLRSFSSISNSSRNGSETIGSHLHSRHERLIVVGSGVAGSAAALIAAEVYKIPVTLMFAGNLPQDCNSWWAQGGIIYRNYDPSSGDSAASLARDIHRAGAGLCVDDAVQKVSEEGPGRVRQLLLGGEDHGSRELETINDGDSRNPPYPFANVPFDRTPDGELSLCLGEFH